MKLRDVSYLTKDQGKKWAKFIHSQKSLRGFIEELSEWDGLVNDVNKIVCNWKPNDFDDFKKCIALEKKGIFTGEANAKRFAVVMMPAILFKASYVAIEMKVPWGLAVKRLVEFDSEFAQVKS